MTAFNKIYFEKCAAYISDAKSPEDVLKAWLTLQGQHPELNAITALPKYNRELTPRQRIIDSPVYKKYLVNYFTKDNIYFISDDIIKKTIEKKEVKIPVDYTLAFDTNIASYINKVIQGRSLGKNQTEVITLLDQLLTDDVNFDHLFYLSENTKQVYTIAFSATHNEKPFTFWKKINKNFRWNLVSLELFRNIDCKKYKASSSAPETKISFRTAVNSCIRYVHDFYISELGQARAKKNLMLQRTILLSLITVYRIQFSSKKQAKSKIEEYFKFIQSSIGIYLDREAIIAHKYFSNRKSVPFLNQVNLGILPKRFLKKLDNMAWDMAVPRFMEELVLSGGEGQFMTPFFLSFDKELKNMLNSFLIKSTVIDSRSGGLVPIAENNTFDYFQENGCDKIINWFFSPTESKQRRNNRLHGLREINIAILKEYRELRKVYTRESRSKK